MIVLFILNIWLLVNSLKFIIFTALHLRMMPHLVIIAENKYPFEITLHEKNPLYILLFIYRKRIWFLIMTYSHVSLGEPE